MPENILIPSSSGGGGSGTVTSVSSADTSIVVTNGTTTPSLQVASLATIAANEGGIVPVANLAAGGFGVYGDGSDGAVTFDGTTTLLGVVPNPNSAVNGVYTMNRDWFLGATTLNTGISIVTNGFRLFVQGVFTNNGTVQWNGTAASGTNGATGGAALSNNNSPMRSPTSSAGANGGTGNGSAGSNYTTFATRGARGGTGGTGATSTAGSSGTISAYAARDGDIRNSLAFLGGMSSAYDLNSGTFGMGGGSGGGAGGGDATNNGGGGGGGGGFCPVAVKTFAGTGAVQARGGAGGTVTVSTLGAGGGGGGGGGVVLIVSSSVSAGAIAGQTIDANGGAAGTGLGTTFGAANNGANGAVILIPN